MKKKFIFVLIFFLAYFLRFYQLGTDPPSLDWDEASLGYNAYSLLKTGKDEYGNFWPLSIRSFNDYKPPLYTYLTIFSIGIFGLNEFSVRFISAFFGFFSVIVALLLVKELFPRQNFLFFALSIFFFSVSPWHLQFSRVAFEANLALFFFIFGFWLFLKGLKKGKFFPLSFFSFGLALYSYHSPRLVIPFFLFALTIIFWKEIKSSLIHFLGGEVIFLLMLFPLISQLKSTEARFNAVTLLNPNEKLNESIKAMEFDQGRGDWLGKFLHNRRIIFAREIFGGYLDHFNFDFLFLTGDASARHHPAGMGMLYFWDFPFVFLGFYLFLEKREKKNLACLSWFFLAPVSSALTKATPHAVRSMLFLPLYQIFISLGVQKVVRAFSQKIFSFVLLTFFVFNFFYYLHQYYIHTPVEHALEWQFGYKELVSEVSRIENNFSRIIVTYKYDQPYIYFLFYKKIDPLWYQHHWGSGEIKRAERKFGKYEFRNIDWARDSQLADVLLVGSPEEIPKDTSGLIREIYFPDGSVAFRLVAR